MNEVVLEFNKAGGASFSPKEQQRPTTPVNRQTSNPTTSSAALTKSAFQTYSQSVRKPPAKSPKQLPPLKSLTIQEKVRIAEKERQEAIKQRALRKTASAPPTANQEAEARTFVAPAWSIRQQLHIRQSQPLQLHRRSRQMSWRQYQKEAMKTNRR